MPGSLILRDRGDCACAVGLTDLRDTADLSDGGDDDDVGGASDVTWGCSELRKGE